MSKKNDKAKAEAQQLKLLQKQAIERRRAREREEAQMRVKGEVALRMARKKLDFWGILEAIKKGDFEGKSEDEKYLQSMYSEPLYRLLKLVKNTKLLEPGRYVLPDYQRTKRNTYLYGLYNLAGWSAQWIKQPEDFKCNFYNPQRYFSTLARYLLAKYDVPVFMDRSWFGGWEPARFNGEINPPVPNEDKYAEQKWFVHIGTGNNIRTAENLPIPVTKKMAHYFLQAPNHYTVNQAFRFGQIIAMGGNGHLCDVLVHTRLGQSFKDDDFWSTVIQWFVDHAMLDTEHVVPIIDYINNQKFELRPAVIREGVIVDVASVAQPGFSMKGRTPDTLLNQVAQWHKTLRKVIVGNEEWPSCGIPGMLLEEGEGNNKRIFAITELCSSNDLNAEGRAMRHCVYSYVGSCKQGRSAIYSMQTNGERKMTIEVGFPHREIRQARGRFNERPGAVESRIMRLWASRYDVSVSSYL